MPQIRDYIDAVLAPEDHFRALTHLRPVMNPNYPNEPLYRAGNFSVVFEMEDSETDTKSAIKCFTRKQSDRAERYAAISRYLKANPSPYFVPYEFLEEEVWADDADRPVLRMDWVEGQTLGQYLQERCQARDTSALEALYERFREMALWLHLQPLAHGDLKPDNIIVRPNGTLALVDYDGIFVPELEGLSPTETGTPPFTHPQRGIAHFDRHLDDFSSLLHLVALRALSREPDLYARFCSDDRLFFNTDDLLDLRNSEPMRELLLLFDEELNKLLAHLKSAVEDEPGKVTALPELCVEGFRDLERLQEAYIELWEKHLPQHLEEVSLSKAPNSYDGYVIGIIPIPLELCSTPPFLDSSITLNLPDLELFQGYNQVSIEKNGVVYRQMFGHLSINSEDEMSWDDLLEKLRPDIYLIDIKVKIRYVTLFFDNNTDKGYVIDTEAVEAYKLEGFTDVKQAVQHTILLPLQVVNSQYNILSRTISIIPYRYL